MGVIFLFLMSTYESLHIQGPQAKFDTFHICPIGSHMYRTGQIEVSLEPQRSHGDFDISRAQIGHS